MEGNKKKENSEKVKIYDKEMYISQEKLRTIVIIIVIFVIGFIAGYCSNNLMNTEARVDNQNSYNGNNQN